MCARRLAVVFCFNHLKTLRAYVHYVDCFGFFVALASFLIINVYKLNVVDVDVDVITGVHVKY